ncbi:hypothetical protein AB0918_09895 [Streptomyces sp. NPDC006864]|uniref:hypothetical protein n=1 Tax=Streptomyces sp. NPDC006864 TaxID=3154780 RepID=UPI00345506B9
MASLSQFTWLDRLTSDEADALSDLYCACTDLRHELKTAEAMAHRAYQLRGNAERYARGEVFTRHADVLGTLEEAAVNYTQFVESVAWQHVSACVVLATALLERLAHQAPGFSPDVLGRLSAEPTVGELCAALSLPGARLLPARQEALVEWFDQDRQKMLIAAESFEQSTTDGYDARLSNAKVAYGDLDPWFDWADHLVADEISFHGDSTRP